MYSKRDGLERRFGATKSKARNPGGLRAFQDRRSDGLSGAGARRSSTLIQAHRGGKFVVKLW